MIIMPKQHWINILNSVRAKTGKSDLLISRDVPTEIDSIRGGSGDIPTYHYTESWRVIEKIRDFKAAHPNSLVFGAVSDIHVCYSDSKYTERSEKAIKHAAFALETVGAMAECDFITSLGDNGWENGIDTSNGIKEARFSLNALKSPFERVPCFNLVGNHDKSNDTQGQFDLIGSYNEFDVYSPTQIRGYGYKDYTDKKVRVIVLNTCDYLNASGGCALSYEQKDFLMRALDLSSKSGASEWQILLLSHIPLDWNGGDYNYYNDLQVILRAYESGVTAQFAVNNSYALNETPSNYATYSNGTLTYNYSGKNVAKIIANIHGHVHTNKVSKIANTEIARVATANTSPDLNKNESYPDYGDYSITSSEASKIVKVSGTAKDTSATFYCIDLDSQTIYAYGYGADIDRTVIYKDVVKYNISYNLTNYTSSNNNAIVVQGERYVTTLAPVGDATSDSVVITMGGVNITSSVYSNGVITIPSVTGDVVITAIAKVLPWSETISNISVAIRSVWALSSSGTVSLSNSNAEAAIGVASGSNYGFTDRESKPIYVMPVNAKATDVTVTNADGSTSTHRFIGLKSNGSAFTKVFDSGKQSANTYTWTAGTIDYILISLEHTDGSSWAWSYNDANISVKFTNGVAEGGGESDKPNYTNIIDSVGTVDNVRLRSGGATGTANGFASNFFPVKGGDIIRVYFPNGNRASIDSNGMYCVTYASDKSTVVTTYNYATSSAVLKNATTTGYEIHIPASVNCAFARVAGAPTGGYTDWVVTVNEEIET